MYIVPLSTANFHHHSYNLGVCCGGKVVTVQGVASLSAEVGPKQWLYCP